MNSEVNAKKTYIPPKCEHGKQNSRCQECGGSGLCAHGRDIIDVKIGVVVVVYANMGDIHIDEKHVVIVVPAIMGEISVHVKNAAVVVVWSMLESNTMQGMRWS